MDNASKCLLKFIQFTIVKKKYDEMNVIVLPNRISFHLDNNKPVIENKPISVVEIVHHKPQDVVKQIEKSDSMEHMKKSVNLYFSKKNKEMNVLDTDELSCAYCKEKIIGDAVPIILKMEEIPFLNKKEIYIVGYHFWGLIGCCNFNHAYLFLQKFKQQNVLDRNIYLEQSDKFLFFLFKLHFPHTDITLLKENKQIFMFRKHKHVHIYPIVYDDSSN